MRVEFAIGFRCLAAFAASLACLATAASEAQPSPDCHDAIVSAQIVRQVPSRMPDCSGCIVMEWPWFLDLDVKKVVEGQASLGQQTMLSMQHTDFRDNLGLRDWSLRRNSLGGFNVVEMDQVETPSCPADNEPARPYISPGPGQTLLDLQKDGAKYYARED